MRHAPLVLASVVLLSACQKEAAAPVAVGVTPTTAQCMKDTDCKGDRICDAGMCKSPSEAPSLAAPNLTSAPAEVASGAPVAPATDPGSDAECIAGTNGAPAVGAPHNDGVYLCREPVEIYWNDWYAVPAGGAAATLQVKAEGKTSGFEGTLKIDCTSGQVVWSDANDGGMPVDVNQDVPARVVTNAKSIACRG